VVAAACGDAAVAGAVDAEGEGSGDDAGNDSDCKTECDPVKAGCERASAINRKETAAPIVTLARILWVPRGPNAVLDTLLVKRAPASALPGCSRITTIRTAQARINSPYRIYASKSILRWKSVISYQQAAFDESAIYGRLIVLGHRQHLLQITHFLS
jgi:hypothetical protein